MTTTIYLVRHASHDRLGKTLCGRMPGVVLGESGLAEAAELSERFASEPLAAVYSSPLERARQTAEAIAALQNLTPEIDEDLNEIDFGEWNGRSFEALHGDDAWRRWNRARMHARPPGGETMLEAQVRAARFLSSAHAQHPEGAVVAVSHGDVIKAALAHVLGLPLEFHHRLEIRPASISAVAAGDFGMRALSINEAVPCRA